MNHPITRQQAERLTRFLVCWLRATVPGLLAVRVDLGIVKVRDSLGWRDVGPVADYLQVARALGQL